MVFPERSGHHKLRIGRFSQQNGIYLVTSVTVERKPVFAEWQSGCEAVRAFTAPALLKDTRLLCWVLMPDHVHWLIQLGANTELSCLVGALKSSSAREVRRRGLACQVWARGYHDRVIRRDEDLLSVARYIVANPLRAGLVSRFGDYPFWDSVYL